VSVPESINYFFYFRNIEEIGRFQLQDGVSRPQFPYTVKQLVAQEINMEKVRRNEFELNGSAATSRLQDSGPDTPMEVEKMESEPASKLPLVKQKSSSLLNDKAIKVRF